MRNSEAVDCLWEHEGVDGLGLKLDTPSNNIHPAIEYYQQRVGVDFAEDEGWNHQAQRVDVAEEEDKIGYSSHC
jgi:hypothetical protein